MAKPLVAQLFGIDENWTVDLILGLVVGFLFIGLTKVTSVSMGAPAPIYPLTSFAEQINTISTLIVIGFLAPIGEESLFRAIFLWFSWTNLKYFTVALVVSSIAFSAFHMTAYGIHVPAAYFGAFIFGVTAGILTFQTKSLLPAIVMHSVVNISLYIASEQLLVVGT